MTIKYTTYAEAKSAAQELGVASFKQYSRKYSEDERLPANPDKFYTEEWEDWYAFLGTERRAESYLTYAEARAAAQRLGFRTMSEYNKGYKQDPKLPASPHTVYSDDWVDTYDFLGKERPSERYGAYKEAQAAAQRLRFSGKTHYKRAYTQDPRLPSSPNQVYSKDWVDWHEFLGTERPPEKYATLAEAGAAAQRLGFTSYTEYDRYYKADPRLPRNPGKAYPEEWVDWSDFLGTERIERYATLSEARKAAQRLGFRKMAEYFKGYQQDPKLPSSPSEFYSETWVDTYDFLGTERPAERYTTYTEASEAAQRLGLSTFYEYKKNYQRDPKLPCNPNREYKIDWVSWPEFLGIERPERYATYAEASKAAQRLDLTSIEEYQKGYRQDPKLPGAPPFHYPEDWTSWYEFLGKERPPERYATYAEASEAAQRLGFKSSEEYKKGYQQDPQLSSSPREFYSEEWWDWYDFLGTERPPERYATFAEASEAAQRLGFSSSEEYKKGYQQDPLLTSNPNQTYQNDWVDWYDFLGTDRPAERYATLAEASEAAQRLGFNSSEEYKKGYQQDPKLPGKPGTVYGKDWLDWYDFLGTERPPERYATLAEASEAAQQLDFRTMEQYKRGYQQDPKLPGAPYNTYPDWVSWPKFLGNESAFDPELLTVYPRFWAAIQRYVDSCTGQSAKYTHLRAFLKDYVATQKLIDDPGVILSKSIPFNETAYETFVHATGDTQKRNRHNVCADFFDWVLDSYCSDEDDEGLLIALPGYRNPLRTVLKGLLDQLPSYRRSESNKPPLPMDAILRAKKHLIPQSAISFRDLYQLHSFLEDCWFEVDPDLIDKNDPNCVYRMVTKDRKNSNGERYFEDAFELWSPVKVVANYTLLSIPLRGQQICWLDSGEGDEILPVWRDGRVCWVKNTGRLATPKRNEGFVRRGSSDDELSSFITTNKTGKKLGGYSVPYMPDDLAYWVIQLRDWQSKYNPIDELTSWSKISLRQKINKDILKRRGKQAFLFRDPASLACEEKVSPMFTTTAFTRTLPALLFQIQRQGEDLAEKIKKKNSVQYKSQFTPHALRVSLITAYIVDGGMPITVISKLVGHASLVMTIYYTKVGHAHMKRELAAAEKRALEQSQDRYQDLIIQKKIDEARPELIATDRTFMDQCLTSDWPAAAFQLMSIGICPMSGAKCDEGGEALVERKTEARFAPVPSGYLGIRNCPRCRFFITGPAFLGGLSAIANEIILEINVTRKEYHELEEKRQVLDDERYDAECVGKPFVNERNLKKVTSAYEEKAKKLDMLACDLQHLYQLIIQSTELLNVTETENHQLIVSGSYVEMGMHLEEQQSDFRLLAEICANAEIYESASASRAQPLLSQMLDKLADSNGIAPAIFRLTEDQQLKVANQVVQLLMKTTQNDWHLVDQLVNGQILLEDLAEPLRLGDIRKEIESAMNGTLKFPLGIEKCNE